MSKETLLTMGMPVYNEEKYIAEAIESLLAQTYKDFVLIISDNASTDKTQQICEDYAKRDKRIVYIKHKENKGVRFNLRYLLEQAKTPYFMWCGGHDKWDPSFVEKIIYQFKEEDIILSYSKSQEIKLDGKIGQISTDDYTTTTIDNPAERYLFLLRNMKSCNLFYGIWSVKALENCNLNFKTIALDNLLLQQACLEGKFKQYNGALYFRRVNRGRESYREMAARQYIDMKGDDADNKTGLFLLTLSFILESIKVPFLPQYHLGIFTRIWLSANTFYAYVLEYCIKSTLVAVLRRLFGEKRYYKIRNFLTGKKF